MFDFSEGPQADKLFLDPGTGLAVQNFGTFNRG
jgi:hypothetical protein